MTEFIQDNEHQETTPRSKQWRHHFPVFWQLIILCMLLGGLFFSVSISSWSQDNSSNTWVDRVPAPQQNSLLSTSYPIIEDLNLTAKHVFVYDLNSNRVLFQEQPDEIVPLASITKLMTSLVAHEVLSDEVTTTVPEEASQQMSASGLQYGEELTIGALLDYAMVASSNDAAYTLAAAVGEAVIDQPAEPILVEMMNIRAEELQLPSLRFYNSSGLDVSTEQAGGYGSARDVTFLMAYLYQKYPEILEASTEIKMQIPNEAGGYHNAQNTNRILSNIPNILGSKTGYTDLAGGNLTIMYDAGFNRPIIITVLGSTFFGRFDDVTIIIEALNEAFLDNV